MNTKKLIALRTVLIILTIAVMVVIFMLSADNADESNAKSDLISGSLIKTVLAFFHLEGERADLFIDNCVLIVRKTAHFTEYAVLGFLICSVFESFFIKRKIAIPVSLCSGALYAVSDEIHQSFVPGRSCQISDMLLDSAGVMTGIIMLIVFMAIIKKYRSKSQSADGYSADRFFCKTEFVGIMHNAQCTMHNAQL